MRRWSWQELVAASGLTEAQLARKVNISGSTLRKAREHGMRHDQAERMATRAGLHPAIVWGDAWHKAEWEAVSVPCAAEGCDARFIPRRKGHRYCSPTCSRRETDRRYKARRYATDPAYRAAKQEANRRYRASAARAIKARAAARRRETAEQRRAYDQAYREAHREEIRAKRRAYYQANRERELARQREYDRTVRAARRRQKGSAAA